MPTTKEVVTDSKTIVATYPASTAVEIGDLLYNNSGTLAKASAQADQGSEGANQALFASLFMGIANEKRLSTQTSTASGVVVTDGVFDSTCPSTTWAVGDLVGASEAAGGTSLENQQVEKVTLATYAIGYCVKAATSATTVRWRAISYYTPNVVYRGNLDASLADDVPLVIGTGTDAYLLWSTADASDHSLVLALGDTSQMLHITDKAAVASDWALTSPTHPTVLIHSNTTPITDYLLIGGHDGTTANVDVVGGTTLAFKIAGTQAASITATALTLATGVLLTQTDGVCKIGGTTHAQITTGVCIDQAGADNIAFAIKSTGDVTTGLTTIVSGTVETADIFTLSKFAAATGGVLMQALGENAAVTTNLRIESVGGQADATHSAAGRGLVEIYVSQHDGANALSDIGADGNAFAVIGRRGTADATLFIVDEDGEIHSDVTLNVYDEQDDVAVCRAFDMVGTRKGLVKNKWDQFARTNENKLVELGILGAPISKGGLVNHNRLMQLHNGAIWQMHSDLMEIANALPPELQAKLPQRIREKIA